VTINHGNNTWDGNFQLSYARNKVVGFSCYCYMKDDIFSVFAVSLNWVFVTQLFIALHSLGFRGILVTATVNRYANVKERYSFVSALLRPQILNESFHIKSQLQKSKLYLPAYINEIEKISY